MINAKVTGAPRKTHRSTDKGKNMARLLICLVSMLAVVAVVKPDHTKRGHSETNSYALQQSSRPAKPLNYVIYHNETHGDENDPKLSRREIDILMDERCFNEENLVRLSRKLATKYPLPINLFVSIKTSFDQIPPPDMAQVSDGPDDPEYYKHHSASFVRRDNQEAKIRFTIDPLSRQQKTISIMEEGRK